MREVLVKNEEFKDSPVGRIPKDWETVTLKNEINLLHGYAFEGKYFSDRPPGEVLLVPGNFHREGGLYFDENNTKYYQGPIPNNTVLNNGDLLIVMTDLSPKTLILGRVVQLELAFKVLHNQRIGKIIPKLPDTWDKRFLMLVINSNPVRRNIISNATGTTVRHTSPDRITANVVPKPSRQEQRRIAEILDTVDEAIARTSSLIIKLKQTKAGLLQDLLTRGLDDDGKLRDPQAHPEQFKDSPLGIIPKDWEFDTLTNLALRGISNGFFKKPELVGSGYRLINVLDLYQDFGIDLNLVERVNASQEEQAKYSVQQGDCFFTRSSLNLTGIAHCNIIRYINEPALFECHLMRVRPNLSKVVPEFFAYWCRSNYGKQFFMARAKQVTMTTISQPDIALLLVPLPSIQEQENIVKIVDTHNIRIRTEETYLNKLKLQKQGLMQDLLTGKVRVKNL